MTMGNSNPLDLWMVMMRTASDRAGASCVGSPAPRCCICHSSCTRSERLRSSACVPAATNDANAARLPRRRSPSGSAEKTVSNPEDWTTAFRNSGSGVLRLSARMRESQDKNARSFSSGSRQAHRQS